jgi:hypothetical protein
MKTNKKYLLFTLATMVLLSQSTMASESISQDLGDLLRSVQASKNTQFAVVGGIKVRGVYVGSDGECDRVGVLNSLFKRIDNYRICGNNIEIRNTVSPALPSGSEIETTINDVRRQAILYGNGAAIWQDYKFNAKRIGLSGNSTCAPVELVVSYDGDLVLNNTQSVCQ